MDTLSSFLPALITTRSDSHTTHTAVRPLPKRACACISSRLIPPYQSRSECARLRSASATTLGSAGQRLVELSAQIATATTSKEELEAKGASYVKATSKTAKRSKATRKQLADTTTRCEEMAAHIGTLREEVALLLGSTVAELPDLGDPAEQAAAHVAARRAAAASAAAAPAEGKKKSTEGKKKAAGGGSKGKKKVHAKHST